MKVTSERCKRWREALRKIFTLAWAFTDPIIVCFPPASKRESLVISAQDLLHWGLVLLHLHKDQQNVNSSISRRWLNLTWDVRPPFKSIGIPHVFFLFSHIKPKNILAEITTELSIYASAYREGLTNILIHSAHLTFKQNKQKLQGLECEINQLINWLSFYVF